MKWDKICNELRCKIWTLLQNAPNWFLGQGKLNCHDAMYHGLQKQSCHTSRNILWPFDFNIDCYEGYGSLINKTTRLLYLKISERSTVSYPSAEFTIATTDHCIIGKEMLSENGNPRISMICEIFGKELCTLH